MYVAIGEDSTTCAFSRGCCEVNGTTIKDVRPKKYMCVSNCMVFKIRVGRSGFFFWKPTSVLLPLKSHKLVSFFLTTAY
jgi:hypothetical protein